MARLYRSAPLGFHLICDQAHNSRARRRSRRRRRATYTYTFTPKILGSYSLGTLALQSGEFRLPVNARSSEVIIRILNSSPFPSRIVSATWEGEWVNLQAGRHSRPRAPTPTRQHEAASRSRR